MQQVLPAPRISRFEKLGFGLFVHYGLYSQLEQGEWALHIKKKNFADYKRLMDSFTVEDFDAGGYVRLAKAAGMRYACFTTRHSDGFSLYDTCGQGTYDSLHAPAGRDLVAEFVEACRAEDIVPFLYHATLDWSWRGKTTWDLDAAEFDAYLDYLYESVEMICTNYGPLGGLWFDGNWSRPDMDWKLDELYGMVRRLQPEAIITNNTGIHKPGETGHPEIDCVTYENQMAKPIDRSGHKKYLAGEMCQTMNTHWGIAKDDYAYKSVAELIKNLAKARRVGANYLLNLGPEAQGRIPDLERATLERLGAWTHLYANALYEAAPCGVSCAGDDFVLKKNNRYYWFVFNLEVLGHADVTVRAGDELTRSATGFARRIESIRWMDNNESLQFTQTDDALSVEFTGYHYGENRVVRVAELLVS
jgi:alpha-L-fucosidase